MEPRDVSIRGEPTGGPPDPDDLLWRQLDDASGPDAYARTWLALQCRMIAGVASAVLVLRAAGSDRFTPSAFWPEGRRPRPHLADVAERALKERHAIAVPVPLPQTESEPKPRPRWDVAHPLEVDGELFGVVAVDVVARGEREAESITRQLAWGAAWLRLGWLRNDTSHATVVRDRLQTVFDLVAAAFGQPRFTAAALALVTAVATRLDADRVTLGFVRGGRARAAAVSHTARFSRSSNVIRAIEQAMDEAIDQRSLVVWPQPLEWHPQVARAHAEVARQHGIGVLCTVPLVEGDDVLGALTIERPADRPFDAVTLELIDTLAELAGPVLERHRRDDRWIGAKLAGSARHGMERVLGPGHLGIKLALALATAVVVFMATATGEFRVAANAALEPVVRQAVTAPFSGYVASAPARAGDLVKAGAVLAALDDRELRLNRFKWQSQQEQLARQHDQAMAVRNLAGAVILAAQVDQARAEVSLLDHLLTRTRLTAPFTGIVVAGDLSQSLAAPVERGQALFEVAPLDSYRVVLQVDERDLAYVRAGKRGMLVLKGTPAEPLPFVVDKITPVAAARDGYNQFRVEAKLEQLLEHLRPGMEGVGKITIDDHRLIWIWTRQVQNWVRLKWWTWLP